MLILTVILAIILSCISTSIMSYISMAVPIGPWIETTLVLIAMLLLSIVRSKLQLEKKISTIGLATAAGGIGGILATGMGFSFPTLYFLDKNLFNSWISNPLYFCAILSFLSLSAGSLGIIIASFFEEKLIVKEQMPFAIGQLVHKIITAQNQLRKAISLFLGFISTIILLYAQSCLNLISKQIYLISKWSFSIFNIGPIVLRADLIPMLWSIGFVTGHLIVVPLIIGFIAKIIILEPLYYLYTHETIIHIFLRNISSSVSILPQLPFQISKISIEDFSIAFCSGMVIYGVLLSFIGFPKIISKAIASFSKPDQYQTAKIEKLHLIWALLSICLCSLFFTYFKFSILSQIFILVSTAIWTYQVLIIAGEMSLAPLGRFATFVMVPGMILFGFNVVQSTLTAAFVEIVTGVASDTLFGRKLARLSNISHKNIVLYQWLGLIISALTIGIIFWLIITHFGLGANTDLPVIKAYGRALLINSKNFDIFSLIFGIIFGYILTKIKINPALVLGGILMPPHFSLILIAGGLSTYLTKDKEEYYPLWSGVFAANSIWMISNTIFKCFFIK